MARELVIVESVAKAKTLQRYLGEGYEVKASHGHVRDLPEDEFGVDVEHGFEPKYKLLPKGRRIVAGLKKSSEKADRVYLAPDPDREGEAIAWHLKHALGLADDQVLRATFHEITRDAVRKAFEEPRPLNMDLVNAQQARRILDRIVGYELSPLISRKITRGLSAGRVQSVALRIICEREREVEAFEPEEYWEIVARLARSGGTAEFEAELEKLGEDKVSITSAEEAQATVEKLSAVPYRVQSVDTRRKSSRPSAPFITSTLQQVASSRLGMTTEQVMRVAQQLYEGMEIAGESEGLITYMRTDSTRVSAQAIESVRRHVESMYGREYVPAKPNFYKSPKSAQAAHEAIRPTDVSRTPESIKQYLSDKQMKLYDLIWRRFVASQMAPAVYMVTRVEIEAGEGLFIAHGRKTKFDGYTRVLAPDADESAQPLPELAEGEHLDLRELVPSQHFTQPPPRYTEGSLVREMERLGIGRPSTYAPTISTLLRRNYVRRQRRTLRPTDLGFVVTDKLVEHFPRELDFTFTSDLEEKLDTIESGETDWREVLGEFYEQFRRDLDRAREEMKAVAEDGSEEEKVCEKCGKKMVVRFSRKGDKFLGCSGYPECDHTISLASGRDEEAQQTEHTCPKCGAPMLLRRGRRGRAYLACSAYPKCSNIMGLDRDGNPVELAQGTPTGLKCGKCGGRLYLREDEGGALKCSSCSTTQPVLTLEDALQQTQELSADAAEPCDECGSPMAVKRSRKGYFLGCSRYPDCKGTRKLERGELPAPVPTRESCEKCGRPMLLRWGRYGRFLACSGFPRCRNTRQLSSSMPPCPQPNCAGHLTRRVSAQGDELYGCTRFPECDYTCQELPKKNSAGAGGTSRQ